MTPNIVLLRGTSGSGKTTIAQGAIALAGGLAVATTHLLGPRSKVGAYTWDDPALLVLGRYDATCGGCDAQSWKGAADDQERLLLDYGTQMGRAALLEGLMVSSWGVERLLRLDRAAAAHGGRLTVVHLQTPLDVCLESVNARRLARARAAGKEPKPLNTTNTRDKHRTLEVCSKMNERAGVRVERLGREDAAARVAELLGVVA